MATFLSRTTLDAWADYTETDEADNKAEADYDTGTLVQASTGSFAFHWSVTLASQYIPILLSAWYPARLIGLIMCSKFLFGFWLVPAANLVSDRVKRRKPIIALSAVGIALSLSFAGLLDGRIVVIPVIMFFLCCLVADGPYLLFLAEQSSNKSRVSLFENLIGFGGGIALLGVGIAVLSKIEWESARSIIFGISAVLVFLAYMIPVLFAKENFRGNRRKQAADRRQRTGAPPSGMAERRSWRDRRQDSAKQEIAFIRQFSYLNASFIFAKGCFDSFHVLYLKHHLGVPDVRISLFMLIVVCSSIAGMIAFLKLSERIGRVESLVTCLLILCAAMACFNWFHSDLAIALISAFVGFCFGGIRSLPFVIVNEMAPKGNMATIQSMHTRSNYTGYFLSGCALGFLIDGLNGVWQSTDGYRAIYWTAVVFLAGAITGLLVWNKAKKQRETAKKVGISPALRRPA